MSLTGVSTPGLDTEMCYQDFAKKVQSTDDIYQSDSCSLGIRAEWRI